MFFHQTRTASSSVLHTLRLHWSCTLERRIEGSMEMRKLLIGGGLVGLLALAVLGGIAGFGFVSTAFAQGPTPNSSGGPGYGACHDNTAVLQLLGLTQPELLAQRQAGKSLLDIAKAKGVDEIKLLAALLQPVSAMHAWMGQTSGNQTAIDQMTQAMRDQTTKDIREPKLGTITDFRLGLGGTGYGMMGGANGNGMMEQSNPPNGWGGMMGGTNRNGMMGGVRR